MVHIDDTIIAGVSEVRNHLPELLVKLVDNNIIVTRRGEPVAVIQSYSRFKSTEAEIERIENGELLKIALERDTEDADWVSHEEMKKWLKNLK